MEPVIYSPEGALSFEPTLPKDWNGKVLAGSEPWTCSGQAGTLVVQKFHDEEFSICYAVCEFAKKTELTWTEGPRLRLQFLLNGELSYRDSRNKRIRLETGQVNAVWAPGRTTTAVFSKGISQIFQIGFSVDLVRELSPDFPDTNDFQPEHLKRVFDKESNDSIYKMLDTIHGGHARRFFYKTRSMDHLLDFWHPPADKANDYPDHVKQTILKIDRLILERLDHHYTTKELADIAYMTEASLLQAFKDIVGVTMFDRYKEAKLELAKKYLLETDARINELYRDVGYASYSGFIDAFTAHFGTSPRQFRKKFKPFD